PGHHRRGDRCAGHVHRGPVGRGPGRLRRPRGSRRAGARHRLHRTAFDGGGSMRPVEQATRALSDRARAPVGGPAVAVALSLSMLLAAAPVRMAHAQAAPAQPLSAEPVRSPAVPAPGAAASSSPGAGSTVAPTPPPLEPAPSPEATPGPAAVEPD